ncbi:TetR/AcrR family transcriptional regulator [Sphingomonas jatrophae]|uniref:Transcriptional regulator, TetR family n=1 Tax=Sphingomonas jatrophae TaxID=1166337 RepID=A0A1I6KBQ0_9SPHN|nr:TetR/AcrR family transcriptional regulator [Sphingomonas jatrophae]SFR88715.1 transcriptional regulator, TetR family [Sphingomonas jatrophae]
MASVSPGQLSPPAATRTGSTREELLIAAERVFARHGFAGASLDEVAEQVGIRRPSLLHHFRSKRELYDAVERRIFEELNAHLTGLEAEGAPFERLMTLLNQWLTFMVERPTAARIILRNSSDLISRPADPVEFSWRTVETFVRLVEEGIAAGAFRPIKPVVALNILGSAVLSFVCNADQFGHRRRYDATGRAERAEFESALRRAAWGVLAPA